jgi:hypothetical protein
MMIAALAACSAGAGNGIADNHATNIAAPARVDPPPAPLHGSRAERIAQIFQRIMNLSNTHTWEDAQSAFPDVHWDRQRSETYEAASNVMDYHVLDGSIDLAGADYEVAIAGTREKVTSVSLRGPPGAPVARARIDRALASLGISRALIGCVNADFGYYRLRSGERSIVLSVLIDPDPPGPGPVGSYSFDLNYPISDVSPARLNRSCA